MAHTFFGASKLISASRATACGARLSETLASRPECRELPVNEEPCRIALDLTELLDGVLRDAKKSLAARGGGVDFGAPEP